MILGGVITDFSRDNNMNAKLEILSKGIVKKFHIITTNSMNVICSLSLSPNIPNIPRLKAESSTSKYTINSSNRILSDASTSLYDQQDSQQNNKLEGYQISKYLFHTATLHFTFSCELPPYMCLKAV